ncbi:hypothetical protein ACHMW6_00095 (plasmid) [Pseudoduganella sp. UC29_106]|uniref:hypothetical protein n=1 Tax=Pseudoduganella sp. UC29_106 TaxID=3374553 RepID=UPI0037564334
MFEGLIRPEDKKELKKAQAIGAAKTGEGNESEPKAKALYSDKLVHQLTAHRTAGLQAELMVRPGIALVVLTHTLAIQVFGEYGNRAKSAAVISLTKPHLKQHGDCVKESPALALMNERHQYWADLMPTRVSDLMGWLFQQEQSVVLELLAYCTACSLDTVQGTAQYSESKDKEFAEVANAVSLNMADWWKPTKDNYFAQVSKQHTISLVASHVSAEMVAPLSDLKKNPSLRNGRAAHGRQALGSRPDESLRLKPNDAMGPRPIAQGESK